MCEGLGYIDIDVQYLPDIRVVCPRCHGGALSATRCSTSASTELTIADVLT